MAKENDQLTDLERLKEELFSNPHGFPIKIPHSNTDGQIMVKDKSLKVAKGGKPRENQIKIQTEWENVETGEDFGGIVKPSGRRETEEDELNNIFWRQLSPDEPM